MISVPDSVHIQVLENTWKVEVAEIMVTKPLSFAVAQYDIFQDIIASLRALIVTDSAYTQVLEKMWMMEIIKIMVNRSPSFAMQTQYYTFVNYVMGHSAIV